MSVFEECLRVESECPTEEEKKKHIKMMQRSLASHLSSSVRKLHLCHDPSVMAVYSSQHEGEE